MDNDSRHPRDFIPKILADEIRSTAFDAEQQRKLHDKQLTIIQQQNLFNLYVPKEHGGLELSLPEILRIEEGLSWADGSTAWVVTLCSGAAWFVGFLDPALSKEIFQNDKVCFAGSGAVTGIANRTEKGYELNGYWQYATGSLLATVFTVNCLVKENGIQQYGDDGSPMVHSFVLKKGEVQVNATWSSMGMIATGSHSLEVKNILVPLNRSFVIHPSRAILNTPVFQYPFLQLAETTLAVNISGMACRFLDLAEEIFSKRTDQALIQKSFESRRMLNQVRSDFFHTAEGSWEKLISTASIPVSILKTSVKQVTA